MAMGAGSLQQALQLMRATAVDVVLMACKLPETNSLEAWQALNDVAGNQPLFVGITPGLPADELAPLQAVGLTLFMPPDPNQEQLRQILSTQAPDSAGACEDALEMPLMDSERLEDLLEICRFSGVDATREIITTFVESSEKRLALLQQLLEARDHAGVRRIRHGWAGIAGSLGAGRLAQTLKTLDPAEMLQSPEYSLEVMAQLRVEFDDTREIFDALAHGLTCP
jgi:HPt (histidine-containing phosphotransfer) domain-containing protein